MIGALLLYLIDSAALMACVAFAWEMSGRRMWTGIALVLVFAIALIPAASIPQELPEQVTGQRAGQIDRAILRYREETGRYPASLDELTPRYLLLIPKTVSHWRRAWCYDGGESYYHLGYAIPLHFSYPGEIDVKLYASAGEIPAQEMPCWAELKRIKERYP